MIGSCPKPAESSPPRSAATMPSIIPEGAIMSTPACAAVSAWRTRFSSVASFCTCSPATTPQ